MLSFRPDKNYADVTRITPPELEALGVRGLLLDIDGTLMPTRGDAPDPRVLAWLETLRQAGIALYILSNSRRAARVRALGERLGLPYAFHARKPRRSGFLAAAKALGLPPHQLAMVGDQIYTDTLGARRAGILALLVDSTDTGLWYHPLRRLFEIPFLKARRP